MGKENCAGEKEPPCRTEDGWGTDPGWREPSNFIGAAHGSEQGPDGEERKAAENPQPDPLANSTPRQITHEAEPRGKGGRKSEGHETENPSTTNLLPDAPSPRQWAAQEADTHGSQLDGQNQSQGREKPSVRVEEDPDGGLNRHRCYQPCEQGGEECQSSASCSHGLGPINAPR